MTPLSAFRSRIAPRVLTALDLTIDQAVLDTCIDFCEQSLILKATLDPINTVAGASQYDVESVTGDTNVCKIMRVWCQSRELQAIAEDRVPSPFGYTDTVAGLTKTTAFPQAYHEPAPAVIALFPPPDAVYQLTLRGAVKPKRSAVQVDDVLYENWVEGIVDGALYRLYSMPGMHFTNPAFAGVHSALYKAAVNRATIEATRGRTRAEQFVRPIHI